MDFFLTGPCPLAPKGERPDPACASPYADEAVIDFLENRCGLSREHPLPGAIFDTHDKALDFWQARMREGALRAPFEVVHVDKANYLLFALAFRWISRLVYVRNPRSRQDVPTHILDFDGNILLRSDVSALMEGINGMEPAIPFEVVDDYTAFCETGYDFVTMAQSPRYAPATADRIMDLLRPYVIEI